MPLGVVIVEGKQYSGSLITARLAMELGREVFGVPGNATPEVSVAPNPFIQQGAKRVASEEDVIRERPTRVRAALLQAETVRKPTTKSAGGGRAKSNREKDLRAAERRTNAPY